MMVIIGLTGSIGMGKTNAANNFKQFGIPVHNADRVVHEMMCKGGEALRPISELFPAAFKGGIIDRKIIAQEVFADMKALKSIESILHPLVLMRERRFLSHCARQRRGVVVLDIPLLFETRGEERCDKVITVSAPEFVQRQRVISRPGMTYERFKSILARQMSDEEKRYRSDFVVLTGLGRNSSLLQIRKIVGLTKKWTGKHWPKREVIKTLSKG